MVYYRKYRPQTLDELVGQTHIVETLKKAFLANRLAQSYLFCGPKGTGKTSTARILAKMVNCQKGGGDNCEVCTGIADGSYMDLIEIDAASNRGIDDIREIREKVKLAPSLGKKKVYIIDEVHMLSNEAFNALLKTLEEPPAHVLFLLATTEIHKIPETILSRVQKLEFKLANSNDLVVALQKVVDGEKIKINKDALNLLAKKSGGSFRDAIKLLDQMSSLGEEITTELVEKSLKSSDFSQVTNLLQSVFKKEPTKALELVLGQLELGINLKEYLLSILDVLHSLLYIKYNLGNLVKEDFGTDRYTRLSELATIASSDDIIRSANLFQVAFEKTKVSFIPSFPLEVAIVEAAAAPKMQSAVVIEEQPVIYKETPKAEVIEKVEVSVQVDVPITQVSPSDSSDLVMIKDKWNYILETIKPYNYSLEALLKLAKIQDCANSTLILEVPYSFHQRIIDAPKSRNLLESVLSDVLGKPTRVSTILGKRPIRSDEVANVEIAADDEIIRIASEIFNAETLN